MILVKEEVKRPRLRRQYDDNYGGNGYEVNRLIHLTERYGHDMAHAISHQSEEVEDEGHDIEDEGKHCMQGFKFDPVNRNFRRPENNFQAFFDP